MKEIYVVVEEYTTDYDNGLNIRAFNTLKKAKEYKEYREKEIDTFGYDTIEKDEMFSEYYNDGEYYLYHTTIRIKKLDLDIEIKESE